MKVFIQLILKTLILSLLMVSCNNRQERVLSPIHKNNYDTVTTYNEMQSFLKTVAKNNAKTTYKVAGKSEKGRDIPFLVIYNSDKDTSNLLDIFIIAQQHGDEPAGKEGALYYLEQLANENIHLPDNVRLIIIPSVNPDGASLDQRSNYNGVDLNRDHLLLNTKETQVVHKVFHNYLPEVTIDMHEYEYYSKFYEKWGYFKNTDILVGGLTNPNVDEKLMDIFYEEIMSNAGNSLVEKGYSFGEYMLGEPFVGKVMGTSTVNIFDGRQSFGIMGTLAMIVEGRYGLHSNDDLHRRTKSQYEILKGIIETCALNNQSIMKVVHHAREQIIKCDGCDVAIRYSREKSSEPYHFAMLSKYSGKDSVFTIKGFYPKVLPADSVKKPKGYLLDAKDTNLVNWLNRNQMNYNEYVSNGEKIFRYIVVKKKQVTSMEGSKYWDMVTEKEKIKEIPDERYIYIGTNQLQGEKIIISLEPNSELALHNYEEFNYLINDMYYPVYRVE